MTKGRIERPFFYGHLLLITFWRFRHFAHLHAVNLIIAGFVNEPLNPL